MQKLTSSFSTKQKPNLNDLIVSINSKKEILFNKETESFMHSYVSGSSFSYIIDIFKESLNFSILAAT